MNHVKMSTSYNKIFNLPLENQMAKTISGVRLRKERAEALREKSIELTIKKKEVIKESDLINFLIDEFTERLDIDKEGIFVKEDEE